MRIIKVIALALMFMFTITACNTQAQARDEDTATNWSCETEGNFICGHDAKASEAWAMWDAQGIADSLPKGKAHTVKYVGYAVQAPIAGPTHYVITEDSTIFYVFDVQEDTTQADKADKPKAQAPKATEAPKAQAQAIDNGVSVSADVAAQAQATTTAAQAQAQVTPYSVATSAPDFHTASAQCETTFGTGTKADSDCLNLAISWFGEFAPVVGTTYPTDYKGLESTPKATATPKATQHAPKAPATPKATETPKATIKPVDVPPAPRDDLVEIAPVPAPDFSECGDTLCGVAPYTDQPEYLQCFQSVGSDKHDLPLAKDPHEQCKSFLK